MRQDASGGGFPDRPALSGHKSEKIAVINRNDEISHQIGSKMMERRKSIMKIRPLNDRLLVLRTEEEQKSPGGIIIPDTAKEKPMQGKVIAAGTGKRGEDGKRTPLEVKVGNRVLFSKYSGTEIKIDGVEHLFMKEEDILGVIE